MLRTISAGRSRSGALVAATSSIFLLLLALATGARAQKVDGVPNRDATAPVNLQLTPSDAFVRIRGWSLPAPLLPLSIMGSWGGRGTITGAGDVNVPLGQISAPSDFQFPRDINGEEETMVVSLSARGDWSGNVDPLSGRATMHLPTTLRIQASHVRMVDIPWPGGWIYGNIDCTVPLEFGPMTTEPMAPPDPAADPAPVTEGAPYSPETGQFSVINNVMTIGGFDCSHPDIGPGQVEDELNGAVAIPSPPGRTDARFDLTFLEGGDVIRPKPAIRPGFTWRQAAPLEIAYDATSTYARAGVDRYVWDMDGDENGDVVTRVPSLTQRFPAPGKRAVSMRVVDKDGDESAWVDQEIDVSSEAGPGVEAGAPKLAPLRISPRARRAKAGKGVRFRVRVGNVGLAAAEGVKVCVKARKKLVRVPKCSRVGTLAPGEHRSLVMKVRVTRKARRGQRIGLRFRASAGPDHVSTGKGRIRVKR